MGSAQKAEMFDGPSGPAQILVLEREFAVPSPNAPRNDSVPALNRSDPIDLTVPTSSASENVICQPVFEQRRDWRQRVIFECDQRAVPLPLEYRGAAYARWIKPGFDRLVAFCLLVLMLPLCLLIALAIKLDDGGPVFFKQKRTGYLGARFDLYKFRTMVPDAEAIKARLLQLSHHGMNSPDFKIRNDPRITRIGRILRKTSLDELPNIINVLKGDMALVGPRPTSFDIRSYRAHHYPRLAVLPGVTGLWQISGRADVDFDERTVLDIRYIRSISLKQDISLLLKTVKAVQSGVGAH
jgi:lipopolysaccharide/colanic/teichoic acid biosynthesis glycosyltransferase